MSRVPSATDELAKKPRDMNTAEAAWGCSHAGALASPGDLRRLVTRLPLGLRLAGAAARDPRTFYTTALAIRRHRALQKPLELFDYLRFLRPRGVVRYLEIGTLWGGMFFAHCSVLSPAGHAMAIDRFPSESVDAMTARYRSLARPGQRVTCLWRNSHDDETAAQVRVALGGAPLDLLFLDGDHSDAGIARDYELYAPLVREGGVIALHDIDAPVGGGMPAFWRRLRQRHEGVEFIDRRHAPQGLGIGAIVKR